MTLLAIEWGNVGINIPVNLIIIYHCVIHEFGHYLPPNFSNAALKSFFYFLIPGLHW